MQPGNDFIVLNIREYLDTNDKRLGEDKLRQFLSEFLCPLNPDVERFLKEQSLEFAKKHQAVTYLILSPEDAELLGYFSITIKPLVVRAEPFSNAIRRKLARFSEIDKGEQTYNLAAAIRQVQLLQYQAGGVVTFVETENNEKLLSFYRQYGFKQFDTRLTASHAEEPHELVQLLHLL